MSIAVTGKWDAVELRGLSNALRERTLARAAKKAGSTALRDMRSEANRRIRTRKKLKLKVIRQAMTLERPKKAKRIDDLEWKVKLDGKPVPLSAYSHRQTKKGVSAAINVGKRSFVPSAFVATMRSGHKGVFVRRGPERLPIEELYGSRPVDALLHQGEARGVAERGRASFTKTFERVLPLELEKARR
jgi:hypothetical protein